ncbi:MAG: aldehyde dehydrogenase family protein [Bradyrhizobium sp.]|nr:aldehyde dehydrogenase family protein [Bradyrhizobium sp.]
MTLHAQLKETRTDIYIDGSWRSAKDGRTLPTFDPATGQELVKVAVASATDVAEAVDAAKRALKGAWRRMLPAERGRILMKAAAIIRRDSARLATVESLDSGKPLRESKGDVETTARYFEYYAGAVDKIQGDSLPLGIDNVGITVVEPLGVTAHIIPWNYPLATTARGVAPALAAGCTAVVKPAEETPLTALMLADVLEEAGLPPGVYNVVPGLGEETGAALVAHPDVAHVTFTGSVETGRIVMKSAADHIASVTLELGGKSPLVVLNDADLDAAAEGALKAIYTNAGQVCAAGSRLVIEEGIAEAMLPRLRQAVAGIKLGRGLDDAPMGPVASDVQLSRISTMVDRARERGVEVLVGGNAIKPDGLEGGWYYAPTILKCSDANDAIVKDEVFGPVLTVQIARDADHALELANGTDFGLVAAIYTADITKAMRFMRDMEAGQVFINHFFSGIEVPFGGVKHSGFGRERGMEALRAYSRIKGVTVRI